jgi:hypothetical protein
MFVDYGKTKADGSSPNPARWAVSEAMARYAGYKPRIPWDESLSLAANQQAGWVPLRTPIFFCPTYNQLVSNVSFPDNNLLNHDPSLVGGNGNSITKLTYLWVANPFHDMSPTATLAVMAAAKMNDDDLAAATNTNKTSGGFCHMDQDADQSNKVDFDATRPCRPGYDYLRKTSDKRSSDVAICVDVARQAGSGFFFYPHGSMASHYNIPMPKNAPGTYYITFAPKAWFNEMFGDGHAESRRGDQLRLRWSQSNPQCW